MLKLGFDLVGVGNPVYDIIETPVARTDGRVLSGCSTNACLAAKKLGLGKVALIGKIGMDYAGKFGADMNRYGITFVMGNYEGRTGGFHLIYDPLGNRTLDVLGVAGKIEAKDVPEDFMDTEFFLVGPILGEVDFELISYLRSSSSAKLFLDPQGLVRVIGRDSRVKHWCDPNAFRKIAENVDFVKPNEQEAITITGKSDPAEAIDVLSKLSPGVRIVTLAEKGSIVRSGGAAYRIPAYSTSAVDPTGAGDVYAGAFITRYLRTSNVVESALFASAAASVKVEQIGPDFAISTGEVERRVENIRDRVVAANVT